MPRLPVSIYTGVLQSRDLTDRELYFRMSLSDESDARELAHVVMSPAMYSPRQVNATLLYPTDLLRDNRTRLT